MMLKTLTDRQKAVLDFIVGFYQENQVFPTLREIGKAMGIRSTNGVADHLFRLEKKGWLSERDGAKSRCIRLTPEAQAHYPFFNNRSDHRALADIHEYVREFPNHVENDLLENCATPLEGAQLVIHDIEDFLFAGS